MERADRAVVRGAGTREGAGAGMILHARAEHRLAACRRRGRGNRKEGGGTRAEVCARSDQGFCVVSREGDLCIGRWHIGRSGDGII